MRDTLEMAREANIVPYIVGPTNSEYLERLKAFESFVRADEREACAKVADRYVGADPIADAIRARGETK
jgi:hypothetical protein